MYPSLIGIIASSGVSAGAAGDFESIATVTVGGGGSSSISFTSIPSTYQHLQLRYTWRTATAGEMRFAFNSDTSTTLYYRHFLQTDGSSAGAGGGNSREIGGYNDSSTAFTSTITDILDYGNTNKNKTTRSIWGYDQNGSGFIALASGLWRNTAGITQIDLTSTGGNFVANSSFALYGIKG